MCNPVCDGHRCWSFVGDDKVGQNLSIGARCDTKAIVEHELLHALGFYHEQSRSDRDDYVKIWWDQIIEGGCDGVKHRRWQIQVSVVCQSVHRFADVITGRAKCLCF